MLSILAQTQGAGSGSTNLVCEIFPFLKNIDVNQIKALCGELDVSRQGTISEGIRIVQVLVSFIFVAIIVVAIFIIIKAAINYIRSEGDETKVQGAQKSIKSVFIGLIALFIGIIGLVLILVIFNALGAVQNEVPTELDTTTPGAGTGQNGANN